VLQSLILTVSKAAFQGVSQKSVHALCFSHFKEQIAAGFYLRKEGALQNKILNY